MLTIRRGPHSSDPTDTTAGRNRFECPTCPYVRVLDRNFFERTYLPRKEIEDVLGGEDAWKNVDKTKGKAKLCSVSFAVEERVKEAGISVLRR
jgi:DNA-directed RNA polymerase III subunit RPC11